MHSCLPFLVNFMCNTGTKNDFLVSCLYTVLYILVWIPYTKISQAKRYPGQRWVTFDPCLCVFLSAHTFFSLQNSINDMWLCHFGIHILCSMFYPCSNTHQKSIIKTNYSIYDKLFYLLFLDCGLNFERTFAILYSMSKLQN